MTEFVELWTYLSSTPLFGLTATLVAYLAASAAYVRFKQAPWANPVLWSVCILALGLHVTATPYPVYFSGAQFIHFLLGPAVVALAWPLWQRRSLVAARWKSLLTAASLGGAAAAGSAVALAWLLGLPEEVMLSMAPKSITAPVAMGVAEQIGGVAALAAVLAVLTGLVGALSGKYVFDLLGVPSAADGWLARGFALGTAAHGIGAARALQVHPDAGAWAATALGLQAVLASIAIPLLVTWLR